MSNGDFNKNTSGIEVDNSPVQNLKATMRLSRDMGMRQRKKDSWAKPKNQAPPPPGAQSTQIATTGAKFAVVVNSSVGCPDCATEFEVVPEYYGEVAECEMCSCVFTIKPPEVSPPPGLSRPVPMQKSPPPMPKATPPPQAPPQARVPTPEAPPIANQNDTMTYALIGLVSVLIILLIGTLIFFVLKK